MTQNVYTQHLRRRAREVVGGARKEIREAEPKVRAIRQSPRFSEEGKREAIKEGLAEIRNKVSGEIGALQRAVKADVRSAQRKLEELRHVPADELSTAAHILAPVIAAANQNPDALINAYAKRHTNLADRRLLEETAQAMIDAGIGGVRFAEKWQRVQTNAEIPEEERQVAAAIEHLREIDAYLGSAATVLNVDLTEQERPLEIRETMLRETARAGVHRFENPGDASGTAA